MLARTIAGVRRAIEISDKPEDRPSKTYHVAWLEAALLTLADGNIGLAQVISLPRPTTSKDI